MTKNRTVTYLGYFMHQGFGSSSTRHLLLQDNGDGSHDVLSKMDQFTTGAMSNVLPILDEIWSFTDVQGLADFCFEYAFDPQELASCLEASHPGLAAAFLDTVRSQDRFGKEYRPEHKRVPADTDLIHHLLKESGLADLFDAPLVKPGTGKKQGKVVSFPPDKPARDKP